MCYDVHDVQNVCTSCKTCNGLAYFHVKYVHIMYAAVTTGGKSLITMDL